MQLGVVEHHNLNSVLNTALPLALIPISANYVLSAKNTEGSYIPVIFNSTTIMVVNVPKYACMSTGCQLSSSGTYETIDECNSSCSGSSDPVNDILFSRMEYSVDWYRNQNIRYQTKMNGNTRNVYIYKHQRLLPRN
jgi:hypothetical protein